MMLYSFPRFFFFGHADPIGDLLCDIILPHEGYKEGLEYPVVSSFLLFWISCQKKSLAEAVFENFV